MKKMITFLLCAAPLVSHAEVTCLQEIQTASTILQLAHEGGKDAEIKAICDAGGRAQIEDAQIYCDELVYIKNVNVSSAEVQCRRVQGN